MTFKKTQTSIEAIDTMKSEECEIFDESSVRQIGELLETEGRSDMAKMVTNLYVSYERLSKQVCLLITFINHLTFKLIYRSLMNQW